MSSYEAMGHKSGNFYSVAGIEGGVLSCRKRRFHTVAINPEKEGRDAEKEDYFGH